MKTILLENGLKIIHYPRKSNIAVILANVKAGSNNESAVEAGISHFIEHMLFEGTDKRPTSLEISNEIEKRGGEFNAATSNERTFYFTKMASKHFDVALDVISDIIMHPRFEDKIIEKEKKIIIDEIKLINDQPRYFQWVHFDSVLFQKHPAKNPVYGSIESVSAFDRNKILSYYGRHYVPGNITLVIIGEADMAAVVDKFASMPKGKMPGLVAVAEPKASKDIVKRLDRKTIQAYMIQGYKTVPRNHPDAYALDVIRAILGRGQSGRIFDEVRTKRGLAYDVGVVHNPSTDFGFFAVFVNTNKKNEELVGNIIADELRKVKDVGAGDLNDAKTFLEGEFLLQSEDGQRLADMLAFWDQADSAEKMQEYLQNIRNVTKADIAKVAEKYFKHYARAVLC